MPSPLTPALRSFASDLLHLAALLGDAREIQYEAAPVPRPRDDTTERAKGGHGDPTPSIALDARRLAVREEVLHAEIVLAEAQSTVKAAHARLEAAVARWNGE